MKYFEQYMSHVPGSGTIIKQMFCEIRGVNFTINAELRVEKREIRRVQF